MFLPAVELSPCFAYRIRPYVPFPFGVRTFAVLRIPQNNRFATFVSIQLSTEISFISVLASVCSTSFLSAVLIFRHPLPSFGSHGYGSPHSMVIWVAVRFSLRSNFRPPSVSDFLMFFLCLFAYHSIHSTSRFA